MRVRTDKPIAPSGESGQPASGDLTARRPLEKLGVLVVDDNHLVRIMVQMGLERHGFDVWLAGNGRDALRLYQRHQDNIDVVLLDLRMPILDGPATLDALRHLNPDVLICLMSGDTDDYGPEELRQHGAAHIIAKPFYLDQLADTLRLLVHGAPSELLPSGVACRG